MGNYLVPAMINNLTSFNTFFVLFAYLVGAIPTGFLICRLYGIIDIRRLGSGNIGATNVSRVLGTPFFFIVLLCDAFKAWAVMMVAQIYGIQLEWIMAALLIGNCFSPFLKGNGGKGVATFFGIVIALSGSLAGIFAVIWSGVFLIIKKPFIASLAATFIVLLYAWTYSFFAIPFTAIFTLLLFRHKNNITNAFSAIFI